MEVRSVMDYPHDERSVSLLQWLRGAVSEGKRVGLAGPTGRPKAVRKVCWTRKKLLYGSGCRPSAQAPVVLRLNETWLYSAQFKPASG